MISTSEVTFASTYNDGFSPHLVTLSAAAGTTTATCTSAALIDELLGSGIKSGYTFVYVPAVNASGTGTVPPDAQVGALRPFRFRESLRRSQQTGQNGYYVDASGLVRYTTDGSVPDRHQPGSVVDGEDTGEEASRFPPFFLTKRRTNVEGPAGGRRKDAGVAPPDLTLPHLKIGLRVASPFLDRLKA